MPPKRKRTPLATLDQNVQAAPRKKIRARKNEPATAPPPTDVHATQRLWSAVSRHARSIMSDRQTRSKSAGRRKADDCLSNTSATTITAVDSLTSASSRARVLRPQNPIPFRSCILDPRAISVDATIRPSRLPHTHFQTERVTGPYRRLPDFDHADIFLDIDTLDIRAIAKEYWCMRAKRLCEAEFRAFATQTFFKGEKRSSDPPTDRKWRSERMLEYVCPPAGDAHWHVPPLVHRQGELSAPRAAEYAWDIRADCAYWLSTRGLNPNYVHNVCATTYVYKDWILSPYLTIEFKREDLDNVAAQTQAVTAAALALYNRFALYQKARSHGPEGLDQVVHYAITFTGSEYAVWIVRPNALEDDCWQGCTMSQLSRGDCTTESDAIRLVQWVNEIHRWGLGRHAKEVERCVKLVLQGFGVETSLVE